MHRSPDTRLCQVCGESLPLGGGACSRHGAALGEARPPSTETLQPRASASPVIPPKAGFSPESFSEESEKQQSFIGQRIGEYVVRRYVGSGGMGVVYEGEHLTLGRKVAIKFIREDVPRGPHARGLLSEARAASAIRHHGIIDVFGFGHQPGLGQYLVMEYLEGRPLSEVIQERAPLALADAVPLLCEVLEALSAAHAAGVIHRDLKPGNIFVVRQSNGTEHIKVLDFGLAKRADVPNGTTAQTHSNLIVGTPQYIAPEQAMGEAVGPSTDLYAAGVIAFELLTGRRPFLGSTYMELVLQHLTALPPVPSSVVPLHSRADELVLRLLTKEPHRRPASAVDVAGEFRALLQLKNGPRAALTQRAHSVLRGLPFPSMPPFDTPTDTLSPGNTVLPRLGEKPRQPTPRNARWNRIAVSGGLLALVLAGLTLMTGKPGEQVPAPVSVISSAMPQATPRTESVPVLAPPPVEAVAVTPEQSPRSAKATTPAKKKPRGASRSASSGAVTSRQIGLSGLGWRTLGVRGLSSPVPIPQEPTPKAKTRPQSSHSPSP
ncbi:serine/threonine-protein kinase [Pyxidicoccus caerfyrddinensis]|uniref:serine/threonine-protein kinase n=1 Tax=Pyxidicoccus caerfyrddinensis TaxID=2709663 RepID=UPI0023DE049E|nr:serine/threonine-protein kinase [Pyxidicoccus caerfyrddinensis]